MIQQLSVGPIGENVYIAEKQDQPVVVFDPGAEAERIVPLVLAAAERSGARSVVLACTHGHLDHTSGLADLITALRARGYDCSLAVHEADQDYFGPTAEATNRKLFASINASGFFSSFSCDIPPLDLVLHDGELLPGTDIRVMHTPGHSPGSCCFLLNNGSTLVSGDTLFRAGRGRTDGFDASETDLVRSIRERLCVLPAPTRVLPGHGPETTIGKEIGYYL